MGCKGRERGWRFPAFFFGSFLSIRVFLINQVFSVVGHLYFYCCFLRPHCRSGGSLWRYRSNGSLRRSGGAVLPQRRKGRKGVRAAVAVLLRVVVLRAEAETTLRPRGLYWGGVGLRPLTPRPPSPTLAARAAQGRTCGGRGFGGSYPVTTGRQMRTARSSVGRGRSAGGVQSGRRAACSCSFRGGSCLAARRIISQMLMVSPCQNGTCFANHRTAYRSGECSAM